MQSSPTGSQFQAAAHLHFLCFLSQEGVKIIPQSVKIEAASSARILPEDDSKRDLAGPLPFRFSLGDALLEYPHRI